MAPANCWGSIRSYVANEGKLVAIVRAGSCRGGLAADARPSARRRGARRSGASRRAHPGMVTMRTAFGTTRIVDMLAGDQLPRIC